MVGPGMLETVVGAVARAVAGAVAGAVADATSRREVARRRGIEVL